MPQHCLNSFKTLNEEKPIQAKYSSKLVELAPGVDFQLPDTSQMTPGEMQVVMRELAQAKGTDLATLPTVIKRNGETATVEVGREYILPLELTEGKFETHFAGRVMEIDGSALGFGQETSFNFTDSSVDKESNEAISRQDLQPQTDVSDSGFANDQGTRFVIQERADGTRAIVLVTATFIDATGKPLHDRGGG